MGYRLLPHTADIRIEAWADSPAACVGEAIMGLVSSFTDLSLLNVVDRVDYDVPAGPSPDMLVTALEEVIYLLDVRGAVPAGVSVTETGGGLHVEADLAVIRREHLTGALPKAVSLHELSMGCDGERWQCSAVIDV